MIMDACLMINHATISYFIKETTYFPSTKHIRYRAVNLRVIAVYWLFLFA